MSSQYSTLEPKSNKINFKKENIPTLDYEALNDIYQDDQDLLMDMFGIFIENAPSHMLLMTQLAESGDSQKLAETIHKIKPTFSMVGIPNPTIDKVLRAEIKARNNELDKELTSLLNEINKEIPVYLNTLRLELEHLKSQQS